MNIDKIWFDKILNNKNIILLGDTLSKDKFAYKIKEILIKNKFNTFCIDKEILNIDDIEIDCDSIVLCMNPIKSLNLLSNSLKKIKYCVIQPGAGSEEIYNILRSKNIEYKDTCLLKYFENLIS